MKHTTSFRKWSRSILLDTALIGGFGYCLYNGYAQAQSVYAFFMWWLAILGLFCMGVIGLVGVIKDVDLPEDQPKKGQMLYDKFWTNKLVDNCAVSNTYFAYHIITDLTMVTLIVVSGRWALGSAYMLVHIGSLVLYSHGRQLKEQRASAAA